MGPFEYSFTTPISFGMCEIWAFWLCATSYVVIIVLLTLSQAPRASANRFNRQDLYQQLYQITAPPSQKDNEMDAVDYQQR